MYVVHVFLRDGEDGEGWQKREREKGSGVEFQPSTFLLLLPSPFLGDKWLVGGEGPGRDPIGVSDTKVGPMSLVLWTSLSQTDPLLRL